MNRSLCGLIVFFMLAGCAHQAVPPAASPVPAIARRATVPVKIDGKLDDAVWATCPVYELRLPLDPPLRDGIPEDAGRVRFAWDDRFFYFGFEFTDKDLVALGDKDGQLHYSLGDVAELFIKPEAVSGYHELYLTPHNFQTGFYFPGRGRLGLPLAGASRSFLTVAATVDGTLNDYMDSDRGWSGEMAVPVEELQKQGIDLAPGNVWRVLVGRYNYSRYRQAATGPELSSFPQLNRASYHLLEQWAHVKIAP